MNPITNLVERDNIKCRILAAPNGKRRGHGAAFRSDSIKARYLARGEQVVGVVGSLANSAILSPAGARGAQPIKGDRILYYGPTGVLTHEEFADADALEWFNLAYGRAS